MGSDEGNGIHTLNVEPQMIYYSVLQTEGLGGGGGGGGRGKHSWLNLQEELLKPQFRIGSW